MRPQLIEVLTPQHSVACNARVPQTSVQRLIDFPGHDRIDRISVDNLQLVSRPLHHLVHEVSQQMPLHSLVLLANRTEIEPPHDIGHRVPVVLQPAQPRGQPVDRPVPLLFGVAIPIPVRAGRHHRRSQIGVVRPDLTQVPPHPLPQLPGFLAHLGAGVLGPHVSVGAQLAEVFEGPLLSLGDLVAQPQSSLLVRDHEHRQLLLSKPAVRPQTPCTVHPRRGFLRHRPRRRVHHPAELPLTACLVLEAGRIASSRRLERGLVGLNHRPHPRIEVVRVPLRRPCSRPLLAPRRPPPVDPVLPYRVRGHQHELRPCLHLVPTETEQRNVLIDRPRHRPLPRLCFSRYVDS